MVLSKSSPPSEVSPLVALTSNTPSPISRMGETDLITGQVISGQPYAGSLFTSQNASTWSAEQTDDLKFHMKVAKFTTNTAGNAVTINKRVT